MKTSITINYFNVIILLAVFTSVFIFNGNLRNYALKSFVLKEVTELMVITEEKHSKTRDLLETVRKEIAQLTTEHRELRSDLQARVTQLEELVEELKVDEVAAGNDLESGTTTTASLEVDDMITVEDVLENPFAFLSEEELNHITDQAATDAGVEVDWDAMQHRLQRSDDFIAKVERGEMPEHEASFYQANQQYMTMLDAMIDQDSAFQQMMRPELERALTQAAAVQVMETSERDLP